MGAFSSFCCRSVVMSLTAAMIITLFYGHWMFSVRYNGLRIIVCLGTVRNPRSGYGSNRFSVQKQSAATTPLDSKPCPVRRSEVLEWPTGRRHVGYKPDPATKSGRQYDAGATRGAFVLYLSNRWVSMINVKDDQYRDPTMTFNYQALITYVKPLHRNTPMCTIWMVIISIY